MNGGYTGTILRIDLGTETFQKESLPERTARLFLGGAGFIVKYLYDELQPGIDPLGPENKLVIAVGPATGSSIPCTSRAAFGAKSPQTGAIAVALSGGYFPAELKFAGYDAVIIEGQAKQPVYIVIHDDKVLFRKADKIWGSTTSDCQLMIRKDINAPDARIACIGPAGEHLSCMAAIINERRAAGRRGLGAVMGSKNLKAIVVRGTQKGINPANADGYKEARKIMTNRMKESSLYTAFHRYGSSMLVDHIGGLGILPSRNWEQAHEYTINDSLGMTAQENIRLRQEGCYGCPVSCSQLRHTSSGPHAGTIGEAEFESIYSLGTQTGIGNAGIVNAADRLCDELGLDTISAGVTVGFAMEIARRGLLAKEQIGKLDLQYGNEETLMTLLRMMAYREGLGDILADGTRKAAQRIGEGTEYYAMHVKGLEMPGYDVRGSYAQGLNYATSYTGADHNRGFCSQELFGTVEPWPAERMTTERQGQLTKWNQDLRCAVSDCAITCGFIFDVIAPVDEGANMAQVLSSLTGLSIDASEMMRIGERVSTVARMFNIREGFSRKDDTLPARLMTEPLPNGNSRGAMLSQEALDIMLDDYYSARQWDAEGVPLPECLVRLDLKDEAIAFTRSSPKNRVSMDL